MSNAHMDRRMAYFSSLNEGDIICGIVIEYVSEHVALVEINSFLVRCIMKKRVRVGRKVRLRIDKLNPGKNLIILKIV